MPSTYSKYASGSAALAASHLDPSRRPLPLRRGTTLHQRTVGSAVRFANGARATERAAPMPETTPGRSRSLSRWRFSDALLGPPHPRRHGDGRREGSRCEAARAGSPRRTCCTLRACRALANEADGPLSAPAAHPRRPRETGAEKGPDARRRGRGSPRRTCCTLRACRALANEADGPLSASALRRRGPRASWGA